MPSSGTSHCAFTMFYVVDNKNQLYEVYMMLNFGRSVNLGFCDNYKPFNLLLDQWQSLFLEEVLTSSQVLGHRVLR